MLNSIASAHHLGCVEGFIQKVSVNTAVQPVHHKLWHQPLSIHEEKSAKLKRLLRASIIDLVDAPEWVCHLVERKSEGSWRPVLNYVNLIKN